jgi:hypothetical protein
MGFYNVWSPRYLASKTFGNFMCCARLKNISIKSVNFGENILQVNLNKTKSVPK